VTTREPDDPLTQARAWGEEYDQGQSDPHGWIATLVLEIKATRTPDGLTHWSVGDLDEMLGGYFPSHVLLDPEDTEHVVPATQRLLRWLGQTGRLPADRVLGLTLHLDRRRAAVQEALDDPEQYSSSKRMLLELRSRGYDVADQDSLSEAMQAFNALSFDERGEILGLGDVPPSRAEESDLLAAARERIGTAPPVVLASEAELDEAARSSLWYQRVRGLCEFVGAGRKTTARGNLTLADGRILVERLQTGDEFDPVIGDRVFKTHTTAVLRGLDLTYELALAAGFLQTDSRTVRALDVDVLDTEAREALHRIAIALVNRVGPTEYHYGEDRYGLGWAAGVVDQSLPVLLVDLYGRPGARSTNDLVAEVRQEAVDLLERNDVDPSRWGDLTTFLPHDVDRAVRLLREVGLLATGTDEALELTPFGTWSVRRWLGRVMDVPVVGTLTEVEADELLRRAGDLPEALAAAEIDRWVDQHGADALARAVPEADETGRTLALRALVRAGPGATSAVDGLSNDSEFVALDEVWRHEVLGEAPPPVLDPERLVRVLGMVIAVSGSQAVEAWVPLLGADPVPMVEGAWRVRLPPTADVLAALGETSDKRLAKAARKALFKHRSAR
jgi:hypothetical protein